MASPEQLIHQFTEAYRRDGSADPRIYLRQLEGVDREELRTLIEAFLLQAPRQSWEEYSYKGSIAERAVASAEQGDSQLADGAEGWRALLPRLRTQAQLRRSTVVERLAAALGYADQEPRVALYYHRMEQEQLNPSRVATKVLEALADILGTTATELRRADASAFGEGDAGGEVFARVGTLGDSAERGSALEPPDTRGAETPDELDRLFTEGQ